MNGPFLAASAAAVALAALWPAPARAQHPSFVPDGIFAVEYAEDPRISPDGRWVAYVHRFADRALDRWHTEIVRAPAAGGRSEPLSSGPADRSPRFSPNGDLLAWVSLTDGFWEIRVVSLATRQARDMAVGSATIGSMAWSPRGDRIAFLRRGSRFDSLVHLYVVDVATGTERRLTSSGFTEPALPVATPVAWTPDGSALLFSALPEDGAAGTEILEIAASGGRTRPVTSRSGPDDDPAVSPDGRWVAYTADEPRVAVKGGADPPARRLELLDRAGSAAPRLLFGDPDLDVRRPAWSLDGRRVLALVEGEGRTRLASVGLDGSVRFVADSLGTGGTATGGTAAFSVSADSASPSYATTALPPGSAGEIVVGGSRPGDRPMRVTWHNAGLDVDTLVTREEIRISPEGGPDAKRDPGVRGWILTPVPSSPEAAPSPLPAILAVHGGCGPTYGARFDLGLTALAAAGHVVLYLDPRGRPDVVLAAAEILEGRPEASPGRIFLLEEHGTGSITRRVLERTSAFAAAVVRRVADCAPEQDPIGRPDSPTPVRTLDAPAATFDEPPSAWVDRVRETLDWFRTPDPAVRDAPQADSPPVQGASGHTTGSQNTASRSSRKNNGAPTRV